jgi:transposase
MKQTNVCGLDVHKDTIFACVCMGDEKFERAQFGTLTPNIEELQTWLGKKGVGKVAMESTGIYWVPVWHVLENDFSCLLVNPYAIKQIPGRKTDVKDAQWIATLLQKGLLKGSYVPNAIVSELRDYGRRYTTLCGQVTRLLTEIDRTLTVANIRITSMASNIHSVTVMSVVESIITGEYLPEQLISHVHGRIVNRKGKKNVLASLKGTLKPQHIILLKQSHQLLKIVEQQQQELLVLMEDLCKKHFQKEMELLPTVPGIQKLSAMQIIAETGADMAQFPSAKHLVSWTGLRPRNDESAGKIKSRATTKGNKHLRRILVQSSWGNTRVTTNKKTTLADKYRQLCKTKSRKKALIAIARKQLVIVYHVLSKKQPYSPYMAKPMSKNQQEKKINYHLRQIEKLRLSTAS